MQLPSGAPGAGPPRPMPTPQQMAQAQLMQQQAMQAALAANPALLAAHQQQMMQARAMAAAQAGGGMAGGAAAGRPGSVPPGASGKAAGASAKPAAPGGAAAAAAAAVVRAAEAVPAKKAGPGRKRRAQDLRLPDRGDLLVPDSPLFAQLQDAERRVDMIISRKKHELQEMFASFRRGPPGSALAGGSVRRKLRLYIRSEHFHQGAAADAEEPPSWALTISGRLIGKDKADKAAALGGLDGDDGGHHHKHHFTHYIKKLEVQLDPQQYPGESGQLSWDKSRHDREHREAIQLRRRGSSPVEVTVSIQLDHQPPQWRLSPALSAVLGLRGLHSVPYVMQALWAYIKAKQLYEPTDRGVVAIRCDDRLRDLFGGASSVELVRMADALKPHLTAPEPVKLKYTIRPDGPASALPDCYDFEVEVPLSTDLPPYVAKAGTSREVEQLDVALTTVLTRLAEHRRRRTYLLSFAQSPVDFIQALVAAQGRDLRMAASKEGEAYELLATGDVFQERWVEDCVINYMARKQQQAASQQQAALAEQQQVVAQQQALQAVQMQAVAAVAAAQQQQQAAAAAAGALGGAGLGGPSLLQQQQAAAAAMQQQQQQAVMQQQQAAMQQQQQQAVMQQQQAAAMQQAAAAARQPPGGGGS